MRKIISKMTGMQAWPGYPECKPLDMKAGVETETEDWFAAFLVENGKAEYADEAQLELPLEDDED